MDFKKDLIIALATNLANLSAGLKRFVTLEESLSREQKGKERSGEKRKTHLRKSNVQEELKSN